MISLQKQFLFIHIQKTGGNSIQNILREYSEDQVTSDKAHQDGYEMFGLKNNKYNIEKHSTLSEYKREIEPDVYKKLFKFATIRNPFDMLVSSYFSRNRGRSAWDKEEFKKVINGVATIRDYIVEESFISKVDSKLGLNLSQRIKPLDSDIDFLIRFEHLNEDFKKVCEIIDIPFTELPHRNKSKRKHYTEYYDRELIEMVHTKFHEEITYNNYQFGE